MSLVDVSVKRPVFALMMTAALIVMGAFSYKDLGLDLMPKTDSPVVAINGVLPGASAEEIETQLTKRIEEAVNTISGIDELRARSVADTAWYWGAAATDLGLCRGILPPRLMETS